MQLRVYSLPTLIAAGSFLVFVAVHAGVATAEQLTSTDHTTESLSLASEEGSTEPNKGEIEERGIPLAPLPSTGTAPLQLVGPTENLTKVINSLRLKHKSLTTIITTAPGLQLTQPVQISILYISPAPPPPGGNRLTQTYQRKFGNRFVYNDPIGEGMLRHLRIDIWLREPKPEGGHYSYSMSWQADLDPVYDITVSPLAFTLVSNCDPTPLGIGNNSEIHFRWASPETHEGWNRFSFTTTAGRTVSIQQFAWTRTELTTAAVASMKLHLPAILWTEHDPQLGTTYNDRPSRGNTCIAKIQYGITYNLRQYPNL
jgi:hypothetical protein